MKPLFANLPPHIYSIEATDGDERFVIINQRLTDKEKFEAFRYEMLKEFPYDEQKVS